jgi:muramoyltetrapeptide carboxypeptidase
MTALLQPPRLYPGDLVRIVAPSGPVPREAFEAGASLLAARYRLRFDPAALFRAEGFLAGPDEHRLAELGAALHDPEAKAIFLARGGYGLTRLLPLLDLQVLRQHPKAIVGFSDATALLALVARAGLVSVHGPLVTTLPLLPGDDHQALFGLLERPGRGVLLEGLETIVPGWAQGPLYGGNLEVFSRLLGTPFLPDLSGAVLVLEEIGERPYRVDRLITHLDLAGVFSAVAAVVLGEFKDCRERGGSPLVSPPVEEVLEERLGRLAIPVVRGASVGHGARNTALPYGARVELDTRHGALIALTGAVS